MFKRTKHTNPSNVNSTLPEPKKHQSIPKTAQWLAGEGAGSWFNIKKEQDKYQITRFSPKGEIECQSYFDTNSEFDINEPFEFTHLSHCQLVNIIQEKITHHFIRTT